MVIGDKAIIISGSFAGEQVNIIDLFHKSGIAIIKTKKGTSDISISNLKLIK